MPCPSLPCSSQTQTLTTPKLSGDPFASLLRDSTARFIADHRNAATDFSTFSSIFSRLIHGVRDPPLEAVWFYSAAIFHQTKLAATRGHIAAVKDLFPLVVSCSASAGPVKRIAVLAPVVCELCDLAFAKEHREEIWSLLEGLVCYISMCCADQSEDDGDYRLSSCFLDVVRVWMVDRLSVGDEFEAFFPIVSANVCTVMKMEKPSRICDLAGIVMCEAFLLRLCLRFEVEVGDSRLELETNVRNCAAQMISGGFQCLSFFETLMKMMLYPVLRVANLLTFRDEYFLRKVLYDSVLMADKAFFKSQLGRRSPSEHLKSLAVSWVLIFDDAMSFTREYNDQSEVNTIMNVLSESCLASHLIKWITNQNEIQGITVPNISTPLALIKWMLFVEDQGVRVFDCKISKIRAREIACRSRFDYALPVAQPDGDLEMTDLEDIPRTDAQRKRKGTISETEIQVKFVKYEAHDNSLGLSCYASEMGNPVSDREMVDMQ